jgi:hypothetical protein
VLWPTIGNHDTAQSANPPPDLPYFKMFTLPMAGAAGGAPSGTEKYYSFDFANIHFICLDSMTSDRQPGSPMLTWLQNDLASTRQGWIIAYWHHPPYSKVSFADSDTDPIARDMRQNVLPILEAGGVDLVLAGHTHMYERSFLLNGHYGLSTTLTSAMILDAGSGRPDGTGAYRKPGGGPAANQGAVYLSTSTSGRVISGGIPYPGAMYSSLNDSLGSVVIDISGNQLDAKFLRETGAIDDYFSIVKDLSNVPPTVSITSPGEGATYNAPASITINAAASDSDGTIRQVDFYAGQNAVGTATNAPYSVTWNISVPGTYTLTAAATDNLGATTSSGPVHVVVNGTPPAVPTGLTASAGNASVSLTWSAAAGATSYNVKRSTASGGPYATVASGVTATSFVNTGLVNGTTYYYVVSAVNVGGESANSTPPASATPSVTPPAPANLTATTVSRSQIRLAWTDKATNETGFRVYRSNDGITFKLIATLGANVSSYSNTGLARNRTYYYRVRAYNASGESVDSNTASATTLP